MHGEQWYVNYWDRDEGLKAMCMVKDGVGKPCGMECKWASAQDMRREFEERTGHEAIDVTVLSGPVQFVKGRKIEKAMPGEATPEGSGQ